MKYVDVTLTIRANAAGGPELMQEIHSDETNAQLINLVRTRDFYVGEPYEEEDA